MFQYSFMQHALIALLLAGLLAGVMGYLTLLRRSAFAAHSLGHISFTGATLALLLNLSPMTGELGATVFAALLMGALGQKLYKRDLAIALVLSFMLGLGMLFLHWYVGSAHTAVSLLFGDVLGVSLPEIKSMAVLTGVVLISLGCLLRPLMLASVAPEWARAKGLSPRGLNIAFMVLLAVAVTLANQVVGILLVFGLLMGPAAISLQWTAHFWQGLVLSVVIALIASVAALMLAFYTNVPVSVALIGLVFVAYGFSSLLTRGKA